MSATSTEAWIGAQLDVSSMSIDELLAVLKPILAGVVDSWAMDEFLQAHSSLAEIAAVMCETDSWPRRDGGAISCILEQVDRDRLSGVFTRWGDSSLVEQTGLELVPPSVPQRLASVAGLEKRSVHDLNAGLAHAYCYLFSRALTPFGLKRDRWLDGRLARILGVEPSNLSPGTPQGTLLQNLTTALDETARAASNNETAERAVYELCRLEERDPRSGFTLITRVFRRDGIPGEAVVLQSQTSFDESTRRYITAFSADQGFAARLAAEASIQGPLQPRYNAALPPGSSSEPAIRSFTGRLGNS